MNVQTCCELRREIQQESCLVEQCVKVVGKADDELSAIFFLYQYSRSAVFGYISCRISRTYLFSKLNTICDKNQKGRIARPTSLLFSLENNMFFSHNCPGVFHRYCTQRPATTSP